MARKEMPWEMRRVVSSQSAGENLPPTDDEIAETRRRLALLKAVVNREKTAKQAIQELGAGPSQPSVFSKAPRAIDTGKPHRSTPRADRREWHPYKDD